MELQAMIGNGAALIVALLTLVQIAPIKIDPWDSILQWVGGKLNHDLSTRLDVVETKLDDHIKKSDDERIRKIRVDILDFVNSCMNGRRHTQEEFMFVISECDAYEKYCRDNNIINGVITDSIKEIHRLYSIRIRKGDFLREAQNENDN